MDAVTGFDRTKACVEKRVHPRLIPVFNIIPLALPLLGVWLTTKDLPVPAPHVELLVLRLVAWAVPSLLLCTASAHLGFMPSAVEPTFFVATFLGPLLPYYSKPNFFQVYAGLIALGFTIELWNFCLQMRGMPERVVPGAFAVVAYFGKKANRVSNKVGPGSRAARPLPVGYDSGTPLTDSSTTGKAQTEVV
ncbi:hypothetical protein MVEN_01591600 [Mycena venus]|uniref:Uncharacterized protein n=1 Tax=Mycena venus TaxID=2733690 RepID=A0A8H7CRP9_9AGAR|nr:hypothetical protein MVEN_01591600 [Mycena venus]